MPVAKEMLRPVVLAVTPLIETDPVDETTLADELVPVKETP
jgi:hypothetical protein